MRSLVGSPSLGNELGSLEKPSQLENCREDYQRREMDIERALEICSIKHC